jgi:hypothetical protein
MYWLNVDMPTNSCKLHHENCRYCRPDKTQYKGINKMSRYGGWFNFKTFTEAKRFYQQEVNNMYWHPCKVCNPT